ncbi:AraC family transcriptional regulator [Vallitalea guaymasensis]|uniref:AraC family transcriptional regulator n=1 Tax=Vallitalea guaymasensis TaxID=1185412 RepID=UPI002356EEB1|nr:AraC family transcriptional regulator [Vallitalea guaymasensis]
MILNDNNWKRFDELLNMTPYKGHFQIHDIHNVELRKKWGLSQRKIHDYLLAYIRDGNGHYDIDGNICPIVPGNMILISPDLIHSAQQYDITPSLYSIRFGLYDNQLLKDISDEVNPFYIYHSPSNSEYYRNLMNEIYKCYINVSYGTNHKRLLNAYMTKILSDIYCELSNEGKSYDMRLERARVYIIKHPLKEHDINELAKISGYSSAYFSKKFKAQYNISPKSYIFENKMKYSRTLLTEYNYSIKEVANKLGYSDQYIFSNQFKKTFGITPAKMKNSR